MALAFQERSLQKAEQPLPYSCLHRIPRCFPAVGEILWLPRGQHTSISGCLQIFKRPVILNYGLFYSFLDIYVHHMYTQAVLEDTRW